MRALLGAPLAPAAGIALAAALASRASIPLAIGLALALALLAVALAMASADRARRLCWAAAAFVGCLATACFIAGPLPGFDLRHAGPLDPLRESLADPLRRLIGEPESGIVRGIVLGERASVDADLAAAFARSGTSHLLAISGFNMTLVAAGVAVLARGRARPWAAAAATVLAVGAYSVLVGLAPSVLRASLMAGVAACGVAFGRRPATTNALAGAIALMLALDASSIADVGFLLSASATAGLLFLGGPLAERLLPLPKAIREGLATTLAATLPTLPIIAAVFGRISLVSPLANLLAVPLFPPLMLAGAATAAVGAVSPDLARAPALLTYGLALILRIVVETSSGLPLASLSVPDGPVAGLGYGALVLVAFRFGPKVAGQLGHVVRTRLASAWRPPFPRIRAVPVKAIAAGAALVVVVSTAAAVAVTRSPATIRIHALDVGQGDAYLVEISGQTLLVDGGPDPVRLLAELGATLPPWTRRIDVVALTHAHADHADGLITLLERYEVGLALEPVGLNEGPVATAWNQRLARSHVMRRALGAGARVRIGDATVAVLSPEDDPGVDVPSLVLRVERGPFSVLFMGDATEKAQADLLLHPAGLASRVYVPPHHGAATPYADALVAAVHPTAALISVGAQNRYGHPTPETLAALGHVPTYRTDRDGTVELSLDGSQLVARTHANGLPPPRGGFLPHAPATR